jgi:hypothetical protein
MNSPMADTSVSMRPPGRLLISSSRVTRRRSAARDSSKISGDAIAEVGELHGEVAQAGSNLVDLALRARQRPRNSSRSLRRSSAMPAVTCSMRSKRSSMVIAFLFQCNPPAGGLVLVVRRKIALFRAERRRRPPRDFRIVIGLENACVGAPIQGARQSAAISFDRAARRRKLRGLSAMLGGERLSLGWGVGSLRVSRR